MKNKIKLLSSHPLIKKNKKYELVNKYKKQLELYQKALEQSFNKKVSKKYIYSTCLGQAIEI